MTKTERDELRKKYKELEGMELRFDAHELFQALPELLDTADRAEGLEVKLEKASKREDFLIDATSMFIAQHDALKAKLAAVREWAKTCRCGVVALSELDAIINERKE